MTDQEKYKYLRKTKHVVARRANDMPQYEQTQLRDHIASWKRMWDNLRTQREIMQRCIDYTNGKQWSDPIMPVEGDGHRTITEEQHIYEQGKIPLKNNMIQVLVNNIVGQFRSNKVEPEARARKREGQMESDWMTCALQYAHQTNILQELDANTFRAFLQTGIACQTVGYSWVKSRNIYDVVVNKKNPNRIFYNSDAADIRGRDITTIGCLEDWDEEEAIHKFAHTPEQSIRLREIFKRQRSNYYNYDAHDSRRFNDTSFNQPSDAGKCRIIQCWQLESRERLKFWDPFESKIYIAELSDKQKIDDINEQRRREAIVNGVPDDVIESDVLLQPCPGETTMWTHDRYWVCYYVTPDGDVIFQKETPYWHKESPFVLLLYPLINGEVHSFVENIIDQQKYINRLITLIDFIIGASAKGVLIFPEDALGDNDKEDILEQWTSYNGVIFAKLKPGMPMPQQLSTNSTNIGATELLSLQLSLLTKISGISEASQGQAAKSGVSASMYAQETSNSQINVLDIMESFKAFRVRRDYKMLTLIQQYYDSNRYSNIAGKLYSDDARQYDADRCRNCEFDMVISESDLTPTYRAMMNQFLLQIFQMGKMSVKTLLKASSYPFADEIVRLVEEEEQQLMAQQQAAQQQQVSPEGGTPANNIGQPSEAVQALSGAANPQAMALLNQAMRA